MRIIGGQLKGRKFYPPKNNPARPTTDFAKEGLFNIIENNFDLEEVKFLDLFGGTGSISFEFASRGCEDITTVEIYAPNVGFIKKISAELGLDLKVVKMDVFKFIKATSEKYNIIFAGPPYPLRNLGDIPDLIFEQDLLHPEGWLILEHNPDHNFDKHPKFKHKRTYGTTNFSIFIK